jgi:hypothetical protein
VILTPADETATLKPFRIKRHADAVRKIGSRVHAQHCSTIALIRGIKSDA